MEQGKTYAERYGACEDWVALQVLDHEGAVRRTWDDLLVRPEGAASLGVPGFAVTLFCPGENPLDEEDREAKALLESGSSPATTWTPRR